MEDDNVMIPATHLKRLVKAQTKKQQLFEAFEQSIYDLIEFYDDSKNQNDQSTVEVQTILEKIDPLMMELKNIIS